ncbi:type II secretion system protein GspJ [Planctomycetota bacterium]
MLGLRKTAFTLLELLVAMVLMVVVSSALYTSLYTGFRARRRAAAATVPTTAIMNVMTLLKHDLQGTLQPGDDLAGDFIGLDTQGDAGAAEDSVSFYTTHAQALSESPLGGIGMIELLLTEDDQEDSETRILVRRNTTNLLSPSTLLATDQVLCRHIRSLNLRYYDGTDWLDAWDSSADSDGLPLAIEIDLEMEYVNQGHNSETIGRHLIQSFPLPCGGAAPASGEGEEGTEGQQAGGGR